MSEAIISPGVFLSENDSSQITQGPIEAGAALVGPSVIGPINIPTYITSYSQYKALFGTTFVSGGITQEYLTSMAVYNYFQQGGESLLFTRVASGSYSAATASVPALATLTDGTASSAAVNLSILSTPGSGSVIVNGVTFVISGSNSSLPSNTSTTIYVATGSSAANTVGNFTASLNNADSASLGGYNVTATSVAATTNVTFTAAIKGLIGNSYYITSGSTTTYLTGGVDVEAFQLETLSEGDIMNNHYLASASTTGLLDSGSSANVRWEVVNSDTGSGVFSIVVRRGDDYDSKKSILETWTNLSLDPNQNNYIEYVIGNQTETAVQDPTTGEYYLQTTGAYKNNSKYVRVKSVARPTPNYFNSNGAVSDASYTGSLPIVGDGYYNGSFDGATGAKYGSFGQAALNMFESIPTITSTTATPSTNIQGLFPTNYTVALSLLGNKDAYLFDTITAPGLTTQNAGTAIASMISLAQTRGDSFTVVDLVGYNTNLGVVSTQANTIDSSYAATYWPWVQVKSIETGRLSFIPPSTLIPAVYEYNDKISAEWFAPAGFTRGGLGTVIQPERRLSKTDRDTLYAAKVNPIASFPGVGNVIYGQKTLQSQASALDRVSVRRMLNALKIYIGQIAQGLVFEQNTQVTRNRFLNQVNPYLDSVQQRQGLYAYQVVMDESNNTPDMIDRNMLVGTIYLQPTKTAEYIQLTFNLTPTGASFI